MYYFCVAETDKDRHNDLEKSGHKYTINVRLRESSSMCVVVEGGGRGVGRRF